MPSPPRVQHRRVVATVVSVALLAIGLLAPTAMHVNAQPLPGPCPYESSPVSYIRLEVVDSHGTPSGSFLDSRCAEHTLTLSLGSQFSFLTYRGYVTEACTLTFVIRKTSGEPIYAHTTPGALAGLKADVVEVESQSAPGDTLIVEASAVPTKGEPLFGVRFVVKIVP